MPSIGGPTTAKRQRPTTDKKADSKKKKVRRAESGTSKENKDGDDERDARTQFRGDLFNPDVLASMTRQYGNAEPYKHGVITDLIDPDLLTAVRNEILANVSFTPKETDIYKIHQSGDLANLSSLDKSSLKRLPTLLKLRDALYSKPFRTHLAAIANAGPLSGTKTDMAINVYTPGCHLLCHDDVIGSRRVSYILYLTDPDPEKQWKAEWGGALRLYPTTIKATTDADQTPVRVPDPHHSVLIPPAFNQLSFFAVQPGESFHDVEEVYFPPASSENPEAEAAKRVRMAISGWFHIPQKGEEGFIEGLEESLAEHSSLSQLEQSAAADPFDRPQPSWRDLSRGTGKDGDVEDRLEFTEEDLQFLLQYLDAKYLVPETVEEIRETYQSDCVLRLGQFLNVRFQERVRKWIEQQEGIEGDGNVDSSIESDIRGGPNWRQKNGFSVAAPPHKYRYLYRQQDKSAAPPTTKKNKKSKKDKARGKQTQTPAGENDDDDDDDRSPLDIILNELFPSRQFGTWLALITGHTLLQMNSMIRRFRRGNDYALASTYEQDRPRLEISLGLSAWTGWEAEASDSDNEEESGNESEDAAGEGPSQTSVRTVAASSPSPPAPAHHQLAASGELGGYEAYMAGDDDDDDNESGDKKKTLDPAVYRSGDDGTGDSVLFTMPACWNQLSLVLRDKDTLRFVKYVSAAAGGDRWDVCAEVDIEEDDDDEDEEEDEDDDDGSDDDGDEDDDDE